MKIACYWYITWHEDRVLLTLSEKSDLFTSELTYNIGMALSKKINCKWTLIFMSEQMEIPQREIVTTILKTERMNNHWISKHCLFV